MCETLTKINDLLRGPLAPLRGPPTGGPPRVAIGSSLKTKREAGKETEGGRRGKAGRGMLS